MPPHTESFDSVPRALSGPARSSPGIQPVDPFGLPGGRRRSVDPSSVWVTITLALVVSVLLLAVIRGPRHQLAPAQGPAATPRQIPQFVP